jgi:single stranded DNA-binding protein
MNINNTIRLIGTLEENPLYVTTENGADLTRFELITSRRVKGIEPCFDQTLSDRHQCVAWGPTALLLHEHLKIGSKLAISGQLTYGEYNNQYGRRTTVTEIEVSGFTFLGERELPNSSKFKQRKPRLIQRSLRAC